MKTIDTVLRNDTPHWVGDGFPVRSLFSYHGDTAAISPFLLFDYAGPWTFEPVKGHPRGVGEHPHKGEVGKRAHCVSRGVCRQARRAHRKEAAWGRIIIDARAGKRA